MYLACQICNRQITDSLKLGELDHEDELDWVCVDCCNHPAVITAVVRLKKEMQEKRDHIRVLRTGIEVILAEIAKEYEGKLPERPTLPKVSIERLWKILFPDGHRDFSTVEQCVEERYLCSKITFVASRLFEPAQKEWAVKNIVPLLLKHKKVMGWENDTRVYTGVEEFSKLQSSKGS